MKRNKDFSKKEIRMLMMDNNIKNNRIIMNHPNKLIMKKLNNNSIQIINKEIIKRIQKDSI